MTVPEFITLGYAEPEARPKTRERMADFARRLGELAEIDIGVAPLPSYGRVAQLIDHSEIDLAWLSPIPLLSLARNQRVVPLVSHHRDQLVHYRCAIVVAAGSRIVSVGSLRGKRAAWVDVHSASGFVLPRIELDAQGVDLQSLGTQRFYGSHDAVVRAVASGRADFGGTFARITTAGEVMGAWSLTAGLAASVRVISTFGEVPPDAIAARYDLDRGLRDRLVRSLLAMAKKKYDRRLLREVFGADDLQVPRRSTYEPMRLAVVDAYERGILTVTFPADEEMLNASATIERRAIPIDPPTNPRLVPPSPSRSGARRKRDTAVDDTEEAEVLETIEPTERKTPDTRTRR